MEALLELMFGIQDCFQADFYEKRKYCLRFKFNCLPV